MNRRRTTIILLALLGLTLLGAPAALAAAGGGSSGFGGGGGGGGGGVHGGRGAGLYIILQLLFRIALLGHGLGALVLIALFLLYLLTTRVTPEARAAWNARRSSGRASRRRVAGRERRVELAAAEAAEDDPAFAPDRVRASAAELYRDIQAAWDAGDRIRLRGLVAPELLAEWERRLDDFERRGWRNRVSPLEPPQVDLVGLTHRGNDREDRVVVRVQARLRDYVEDRAGRQLKRTGRFTETVRTREFWTLGKRGARWILVSIEQGAEGEHALDQALVASPWSDESTLRDEALVEGAVADAVPQGTNLAELADLNFTGDARSAANDLSLADGRFAPAVLEVAVRRAVQAWVEAVDGPDTRLRELAAPEAVTALLHPDGPQSRLVVRGLAIRELRITGVDAAATPPAMTLELELTGRRYLEDRDTVAVVSGSQLRAVQFSESWTLTLSGDAAEPWRLASVRTPLARR